MIARRLGFREGEGSLSRFFGPFWHRLNAPAWPEYRRWAGIGADRGPAPAQHPAPPLGRLACYICYAARNSRVTRKALILKQCYVLRALRTILVDTPIYPARISPRVCAPA